MRVTPPPPPPRGKAMPEMARRMRAIETVRTRFEGKPFKLGRNDCWKLVRTLLAAMGHRNLPKAAPYSTPLGAKRALTRSGFASLEAVMDSLCERIAPAAMLAGDIGLVEADPEDQVVVETLVISLGHKLWGWHPDQEALAVIEPNLGVIKAAWRA